MSVTPPEYSSSPNFPRSQYNAAFTWPNGTDQLWDLFFTQFFPVNPLNFQDNTAYYYELFGDYFNTWRETLSPVNKAGVAAGNIATNPTFATEMVASFNTYLANDSNNVRLRALSPFLWVYNLLIEMQTQTEQSTISQGNRVSVLTNSQQAAVINMEGVAFTKNITGFKGNYLNQLSQQYLQIYTSQQQVQSVRTDEVNTAIQNTNNLIQQQFSLMSGVITQIQEMIAGIFKSG